MLPSHYYWRGYIGSTIGTKACFPSSELIGLLDRLVSLLDRLVSRHHFVPFISSFYVYVHCHFSVNITLSPNEDRDEFTTGPHMVNHIYCMQREYWMEICMLHWYFLSASKIAWGSFIFKIAYMLLSARFLPMFFHLQDIMKFFHLQDLHLQGLQ
jgi:hypothetical protein